MSSQRTLHLRTIDIAKLRINTLHGLCNELLQEYRAPNYQNVRLMDDFEQAMFIYEHMDMVKRPVRCEGSSLLDGIRFLFPRNVWQAQYGNTPYKVGHGKGPG